MAAASEGIAEQLALLDSVKKYVRNFRKDSADRKTKEYFAILRKLLRLSKSKELEENYFDVDVENAFEELYIDAVGLIRKSYATLFPPHSPTPSHSSSPVETVSNRSSEGAMSVSEVPLPEVKLPSFSGNYIEWPTFKEVFESRVHDNTRLNNIQRFHYLKGALTGEAAQDIQHLSLLAENYQKAWDMLLNIYGNQRLLFLHFMDTFDNQPAVLREDPLALKRFTQTCRSTMNSIKKLGVNIEREECILAYYMAKKLPPAIRTEGNRTLRKQKTIPTFNELCDHLDEQYQMLITSAKAHVPSKPTLLQDNRRKFEPLAINIKKESKSFNVVKGTMVCPVCTTGEHSVRECSTFLKMTVSQRKSAAEKHKLCFNCLGYHHSSSKCISRKTCSTCGKRHHTLIHIDRNPDSSTSTAKAALTEDGCSATNSARSETTTTSCLHTSLNDNSAIEGVLGGELGNCNVLLPTAIVNVRTVDDQALKFRVLLDQGSQASFISENAAQLLRLPRKRAHIHVSGLSGTQVAMGHSFVMLSIESRHNLTANYQVLAYVLPKVSSFIPEKRLLTESWKHLKGLELADPTYFAPQQVDLLLGNDFYDEIIVSDTRRAGSGQPVAQKTTLGYIVSGKVRNTIAPTITISSMHTYAEIDHLLQKFWDLEEVGEEHVLSDQDQWCENFYNKYYKRMETGKYLVRLPLLSTVDSSKVIGRSKHFAIKRFLSLERRLEQEPTLKRIYQETIDEYLQLGQMKPVTTSEEQHIIIKSNLPSYTCSYLPHHPVIKESSSTTKVRVVFDASAKTSNGNSLNDILAVGPGLHTDLACVLINWRFHRVAFTADIEKMYRCIDMNEADAQYQRILWRNSPNEEIKEFFCTTVMFGTGSAPYTALRTIKQLAEDEKRNYPLATAVLKGQMYVDDVLSGSDSVADALELQQQLISMLRSATFELRKWSSNHLKLLERIASEHCEIKGLLQLNESDTVKALGMYWNPTSDIFQFKFNFDISTSMPTKRVILSTIARLFDPLGWLNPIIITAKLIIQQLWKLKIGWDDPIPIGLQTLWNRFIAELPGITKVYIPRWLHTSSASENIELHIFCDASSNAYCAAAYLRVLTEDGHYHSSLIMAKCKVSPIKTTLTIPRAELSAAVLAVKLFKHLKANLNFNIDFSKSLFWSDSMIVLGWIRGDPTRWKIFVANRISKILESSSPHQWQHVKSADNPADCSSRGLSPIKLLNCDLWWSGPSWLRQNYSLHEVSEGDDTIDMSLVGTEMKQLQVNAIRFEKPYIITIIERHSSYSRLIRVVAYCHRFAFNCRQRGQQRRSDALLTYEYHNSLLSIIRIVQSTAFPNEWKALSNKSPNPENSSLLPLNPFYDENERLLRLGGRLRDSLLPAGEKHPYLLPEKHHFTDLVVNYSHRATLHGGTGVTLYHLRKRFWVINGRNVTRAVIHQCITCYKCKPKPSTQLMGNLPAERVRPARAFSAVGVDYAGPIKVLPSKGRGRVSNKGYIALFVCLPTKAVHLEPVGDLSTDAFLGALKRFIGRRGLCRDIFSDCGTNFVGANRKLQADKKAYKTFIETNASSFLAEHQIQWHFIPPAAPHFGGLWEAGVKSMKYHLKRIIGETPLTFEELATVLAQIESCLNSRPLCPLSNDPEDLLVLTPGHFLTGDSLLAPSVSEIDNISPLERWRNCQMLVQHFWRRWSQEYLSRLQRRPKWLSTRPNLQVNDIVLIKDERLACNLWPLGRIIETHAGEDGLVRLATLKTQTGVIKRPITKLCPLPISDNWHNETNTDNTL